MLRSAATHWLTPGDPGTLAPEGRHDVAPTELLGDIAPEQTFRRLPSGVAQMEALAIHGARAPLALDIVEAIRDGRQPAAMTLTC